MAMHAPKCSQLELKLILLIHQLRLYVLTVGRCKWQLFYPGEGQGDRGERKAVFQRLGYETNTNSSQGAHAYRDGASVRSVPFLLQTGRGEKEIIHQGKDTARCSSGRRGEVVGVMACWRCFLMTGLAKMEWPCLCVSPAFIARSYLLRFHLKIISVF